MLFKVCAAYSNACLPACPPPRHPARLQVGAALAELLSEGAVNRQQLFITGKLWNSSHAAKDVQPALNKTLQDLGVSCYRQTKLYYKLQVLAS